MILLPTAENISRAAKELQNGGVIGLPTETVYGLAANALNPEAVQKIFSIKGRPSYNPLIVHIADVDQLADVADLNEVRDRSMLHALCSFWPGSLSIVLPRSNKIPDQVTAGLSTVAVRIPQHETARSIIREAGVPVAAPSANPSNYVSPTCAHHVERSLGSHLSIIIDGGECSVGVESTIISLTGAIPKILRVGGIEVEKIAALINLPVEDLLPLSSDPNNIVAPGMLREHYAPHTPIAFLEEWGDKTRPKNTGLIAFNSGTQADHFKKVKTVSRSGDLTEICRNLFSALHELDAAGLDLILIESCEEHGLGRAIMDRLRRATARTKSKL